jgi:four helix bundle protein
MIRSFTDLEAWKVSHKLTLIVYRLTKEYPREEMFSLISQSRRAASSIGANIAEGFGRNTRKDKIHFYTMAKGSLTELQNHLLLARDLGYVRAADHAAFEEQVTFAIRLITGLERSAPNKLQT